MREMNWRMAWLFGALLEGGARSRQRTQFTQRSKPATALQPALTGT